MHREVFEKASSPVGVGELAPPWGMVGPMCDDPEVCLSLARSLTLFTVRAGVEYPLEGDHKGPTPQSPCLRPYNDDEAAL